MNIVDVAREIAEKVHKGQTDKLGVAYIEHCRAVADAVASKYGDDELTAIAWVHDVIEDGALSYDAFDKLISECGTEAATRVVWAVIHLSRQQGESYKDYIKYRVALSKDAIKVKIEDIRHNLCTSRRSGSAESLRKRYKWALDYLERVL